jgi:hypothetical protein
MSIFMYQDDGRFMVYVQPPTGKEPDVRWWNTFINAIHYVSYLNGNSSINFNDLKIADEGHRAYRPPRQSK